MHRVMSFVVSMGLALAPSLVQAQGSSQGEQKAAGKAAVASPQAARSIQFKKKDAVIGRTDELTSHFEMRLDFAFGAQGAEEPTKIESTNGEDSRQTQTVLAARGRIIDKVKVAYGDRIEFGEEDGKEERTVSPVSGKTYLAEAKKGRIVVTNARGKAVPKEEADLVTKDLPELGKLDPLEEAIPETPLEVGAPLERFSLALADYLKRDSDPDTEVRDTQVHLAEIRQGPRGLTGILAIEATFVVRIDDTPFTLTIPLKGTMPVLAEGAEVLEIALSGPVNMVLDPELKKLGLQVTGQGEMKILVTSRPLP